MSAKASISLRINKREDERTEESDGGLYRISLNKRPRSNKGPPPNKHPLPRP